MERSSPSAPVEENPATTRTTAAASSQREDHLTSGGEFEEPGSLTSEVVGGRRRRSIRATRRVRQRSGEAMESGRRGSTRSAKHQVSATGSASNDITMEDSTAREEAGRQAAGDNPAPSSASGKLG